MSHKCCSIAFNIRAVAVAEARRYLFPSIASGYLSYKTLVSSKLRSRVIVHKKSASKKYTPGLVLRDL